MRLFLTCYQKSGTHQIYPMFAPDMPQIIDEASVNLRGQGIERFGLSPAPLPSELSAKTVETLRSFPGKAFGHVAYLPEYAEALQVQPTKVILNVRDPRDVVIAEYESILKTRAMGGSEGEGLWNFHIPEEGNRLLIDTADPISWLIRLAALRWPNWLGWMKHDFVRVVHYETLRLRTAECVHEMLEWLGPEIPTRAEHLMAMQSGNVKAPTFRKGLVGEHRTRFTKEHWRLSNELLGPILKRLGYNQLGLIPRKRCLWRPRP